ncbi:MAG: 16S rRNA (adenine(1518)-N(6)/adenine(1519)-N(6))-dimethyltransferase RsmA [Thermodesulfovibrionales bacterium]|jgi:16S rRNA (adenine1518-N6/adenine1519-N6)-dimethyltransferase|nr:16S rRNA (adenine(1518)-N(6)/adenine(1519)-N(6))-dimethyltransferase RsmA [Thermodesulfovibrionales bacterium]
MPKKYLGQNFLFDPSILHRIVEAADITHNDTVVEIGPGIGTLTKILAGVAKKVIAIELDYELYAKLKEEIKGFNIELIHGDALKYPYEKLEPFKVVANIPYYITTPIIFRLIETRKNLKSMTLTIQKEVAQRIVGKPNTKDYGVLSIAVQYYGEPKLKFIIPKGAFRPVPKVDSAVIHIEIFDKPRVIVADEKLFFRIVKTAFSQRRKTLSNSLSSISKDIKKILINAEIDPNRRAETLSIEEFARLADNLSPSFKLDYKAG